MPLGLRIPVILAFRDASISLLTMTRGVAPSGFPMPRSIDVDLGRPRLGAHLVDDGKYIRGQLLNAVKLFLESEALPAILRRPLDGAGELRFDHETFGR